MNKESKAPKNLKPTAKVSFVTKVKDRLVLKIFCLHKLNKELLSKVYQLFWKFQEIYVTMNFVAQIQIAALGLKTRHYYLVVDARGF